MRQHIRDELSVAHSNRDQRQRQVMASSSHGLSTVRSLPDISDGPERVSTAAHDPKSRRDGCNSCRYRGSLTGDIPTTRASIMGGTRYFTDLLTIFNGRWTGAGGLQRGRGAVMTRQHGAPYNETRNSCPDLSGTLRRHLY